MQTLIKLKFFFNAHLIIFYQATFAYTLRYLMGTRKGDCTARFENLKIAMLGSMDMETYQLNLRFFKFIDVG